MMEAIFIILGLIALLLVFLAWPEISLYALALSVPFIGWNFSVHGFVLPLSDSVAIVALAAFFIRLAYQSFFTVKEPIKLKWPLFLPFFLFIFISLLSSLLSSAPLYSLWYLTRWLILLYFAYILMPYNLINSGKRLRGAIVSLAISTVIVLISGYLSFYGQDWRDSFFRLNSISWFGTFPFGDNHNLISEFLNVGALLFLALREMTDKERIKRLCLVAFIATALAIILTFSRSGWITLILQSLIYFWYKVGKGNRVRLFFISLGIVVLISPLLLKMQQLQAENTSSTEDRLLLTEISLQTLKEKPYLGYGDGQFINLVADNVRFRAKYGDPIDSHGMLQKVLAENGLFGLAAWLFILIYLAKTAYQGLKKYYADNPWILSLILAGAGGLFFQFFNTSYYKGKVWLPIAIFLAALRLLEAKYERQTAGEQRSK